MCVCVCVCALLYQNIMKYLPHPLSPHPLHSLPLHLSTTVYLPLPSPPSLTFFLFSFGYFLSQLSLPLPPGKWHRISLSAAKANLFIITIYLLLYVYLMLHWRTHLHTQTHWLQSKRSSSRVFTCWKNERIAQWVEGFLNNDSVHVMHSLKNNRAIN